MVYIQLNLSPEESQILNLYKAVKSLKSKKQAIKDLISEKKNLLEKFKEDSK